MHIQLTGSLLDKSIGGTVSAAVFQRVVATHIVIAFDQLCRVFISAHAQRVLGMSPEVAVVKGATVNTHKRIVVSDHIVFERSRSLCRRSIAARMPVLLLSRRRDALISVSVVVCLDRTVGRLQTRCLVRLDDFTEVNLVEMHRGLLASPAYHLDLLILNLFYF